MREILAVLVILTLFTLIHTQNTNVKPNTVTRVVLHKEPLYFKLDLATKSTEQVWTNFDMEFDERTTLNMFIAHESLTTRPSSSVNHWNILRGVQAVSELKGFSAFNSSVYYIAFVPTVLPVYPLRLDFLVGVIHTKTARLFDGVPFKGKTDIDSREPIYMFGLSNSNPLTNVFNYKVTVKIPETKMNGSQGFLYLSAFPFPSKLTWKPVALKSPFTTIEFAANLKNIVCAISTTMKLDFELVLDIEHMVLASEHNFQIDYKRTESKYQYYQHSLQTAQKDENYILQPIIPGGPKIEKFYANVASNENPTELDHEFSSVDVSRDGEYWGSYIHLKEVRGRTTKISITQKKGDRFIISNGGGIFYSTRAPLDFKLLQVVSTDRSLFAPIPNGRYKIEIQLLHEREITLQQYSYGEYRNVKSSSKDFSAEVNVSTNPSLLSFFNIKGDNVVTFKISKIN
jgi:hypothetical protein